MCNVKRSFIVATSLIVVVSALLMAFTFFSHGYIHREGEIENMLSGLHGLYAISTIPLLLSIFGLYGACKQKKWALIVFAVGMILSCLFMIVCGVGGLASIPEMVQHFRSEYPSSLQWSNEDGVLDAFKELEMELQCCGLEKGYLDWGKNISHSCLCTEGSSSPCVEAPRNSIQFETNGVQPILVFEEPCLTKLTSHLLDTIYIILGVMLGITLLWFLSVVLSIIILCRMKPKLDSKRVVYSPEAKSGNYITLTDAADYT